MILRHYVDLIVGYMTMLVLADSIGVDKPDIVKVFLKNYYIKVLVLFSAALAATQNIKASMLATYLFYVSLGWGHKNREMLFIPDIDAFKKRQSKKGNALYIHPLEEPEEDIASSLPDN